MPTARIAINPEVIAWAIRNSDFDYDYLVNIDKNLSLWLEGKRQPTLRQLEALSKRLHIPFGYLLFPEPPDDDLILTDYRTINNAVIDKPSRNLVDTINDMEQKMLWMRDYRVSLDMEPLDFAGRFKSGGADKIVAEIRRLLHLEKDWAASMPSYGSAFNLLKEKIENTGVLVMKNGVVQANNHRPLDIDEFRAFLLYDEYAPLIFINGKDSEGAKNFSLIHEFCHLLVSNDDDIITENQSNDEVLCNRVAARFLMPENLVLSTWKDTQDAAACIAKSARRFKVSQVALARRLYDLGRIDKEMYDYISRISIDLYYASQGEKTGGNTFITKRSNLSTKFVRAVLRSTAEGTTLYGDAYKLLNIRNPKTFDRFAEMYEYD